VPGLDDDRRAPVARFLPTENAMSRLNEFDTKTPLTSKTIIGVMISAAAKGAAILFDIDVSEDIQAKAVDLILLAVSFGGDALAVYGRFTATKKIG